MHIYLTVVFKNTFMMNGYFPVLKFLQNLFKDISKIARKTLHNSKIFFVQYHEGFNFVTGKASLEIRDVHLTVPIKAPSLTLHTKADIRNGYVFPQESPVYHKSEKFVLFRKQN